MLRSYSWFRLLALSAVLFSFNSQAGDLDWSGNYRFEALSISKPNMTGESEKAYGLHHLILRPMIVASDGVNIRSRFDIFNRATNSNSAVGQVFGSGINTGSGGTTYDNSNAFSNRMASETIAVTHLYLTINAEHGSFIVGRAPMHFGLGMTHNAGEGDFDHWFDSRDMVGYKMVFGNMYLLPSMSKISEGNLGEGIDDITEYNIQFQYENVENGLEMGAFYQMRKSSVTGNDAPVGAGGFGTAVAGALDYKVLNVYAARVREKYKWALEGSFFEGTTGVNNASSESVGLSGVGLAIEYDYMPQQSKWNFGAKAGYASGNSTTSRDNEGYVFDRNYDVALLLFNHQLGQADVLGTTIAGGRASTPNNVDVEAISNASYFAPYAQYAWKPQWDIRTTIIGGWINEDQLAAGSEKDLGFEVDLSLIHKPHERLTWSNDFAYLAPGSAFKGGTNAYKTDAVMAFFSKVAISF